MRFFVALCALGTELLAGTGATCAAVLQGPVTNSANGHVYYLLAPNSWTASQAEAIQLGGHLVTINDQAENQWVQETFTAGGEIERALWIGLNDAPLEGTFEWASGDPVHFRFWRRGFPNETDASSDFVLIDFPSSIYTGRWRNTRNDDFDAPGQPVCGVVEIVPEGEPVLSMTWEAVQARIDFTGALLRAENVTGPWIEITNAASPYWPQTAASFFIARGPESIFDRHNVIDLTLEAPFQVYFEKAFAGMPDGIFPPVREKPYFDGEGRLTSPGLIRPITVRVRGNSSLQECPFPKLKFKVSRADRAGTPFFNAREIKVGTHCAEGGRGIIGRLRDERATWREALAYEVMAELGFTTPRVRRAQIEYRDTTPTNSVEGEAGWSIVRKAFLLDHQEVVAERLGGRALGDEEISSLRDADFDVQLIADLRVLHALLGNWDFALSPDGSNLWNTDVIELADGKFIPVAGDFDLSSFVTEEPQLEAPWDYHPELPVLEREARWKLGSISKNVSPQTFSVSGDRFRSKRGAIEALIATALIDEPGRANAQQHLNAFYDALLAFAEE